VTIGISALGILLSVELQTIAANMGTKFHFGTNEDDGAVP